jgi:hypothetical protein
MLFGCFAGPLQGAVALGSMASLARRLCRYEPAVQPAFIVVCSCGCWHEMHLVLAGCVPIASV